MNKWKIVVELKVGVFIILAFYLVCKFTAVFIMFVEEIAYPLVSGSILTLFIIINV